MVRFRLVGLGVGEDACGERWARMGGDGCCFLMFFDVFLI